MTAQRWKVGLGADSLGLELKGFLAERVAADERVAEVVDFGVRSADDPTSYPNVGLTTAEAVARGEVDRAILVCGTGIGMAISANKVPGVRAAVAYDAYSVERSVLSNDCQALALGARIIGHELAGRIVSEWLGYCFDPDSPSARKVAVITAYESAHERDHDHPAETVPGDCG